MDPLSAAASLLSVLDIAVRTTSAIINYGRDTHNASRDKKLLVEEALLLSKVLNRLRERAEASSNQCWLADHLDVFQLFQAAFDDLANALNIDPETGQPREESRFKAFQLKAKWTITKSDIYTILQRMERLQHHANALLSDNQRIVLERIDQKQQEAQDQKFKSALLGWLSSLPMTQVHQTVSDKAEKGSGQWVLDLDTFVRWHRGEITRLWGWGIPGAGKTVIASIIVNFLRRERSDSLKRDIGVAFLYLKYNETDQTLDNLLGNLLRQLIQELEHVPSSLMELYAHHHSRSTSPSSDELVKILDPILSSFSETFLIVDGLDECEESLRWDLLEELEKFQPKLRLLITSRYLDTISEDLELFERFEIRAKPEDLELYIDHQMKKNKNLRRIIQRTPKIKDDIKSAVVKTADSMFLLARLHIESLASAANLSVFHVRQKLQSLPTTLKDTYDGALQRIRDQEADHRDVAFKILAWVSYAFRALHIMELQHALAIEPDDTEINEELLMDGQSITALCAGLVRVDKSTSFVDLVHYSAKNYFEDCRQELFPKFHGNITLTCTTYLTLRALRDMPISSIVQKYPLASYAAQYLGDHARQAPEEALETSVLDTICQLLSSPDKRKPLLSILDELDLIRSGYYSALDDPVIADGVDPLSPVEPDENEHTIRVPTRTETGSSWQRSQSVSSTSSNTDASIITTSSVSTGAETLLDENNADLWTTKVSNSRVPEVTALHLAASMGLAKVASLILKETPNIDAVDNSGKTALALAMERGFEKAAEFLVNSGASVDLKSDHGQSILLMVTERDWHNVAKLIVQQTRQFLPERNLYSDNEDGIRLILAAFDGDEKEIRHLSRYVASTGERKNFDAANTAMFLAVETEKLQTVKDLLSNGVDVNAKDSTGQSALFRATRRRHEEMMRLLLANGADVHLKDDEGRTAWSANINTRDKRILNLLLDAGADPSTRGLQGVSELYTAAKDGDKELVNFMLQSGTNPSLRTIYKWAPLHWAASFGHTECVILLLKAGADVSVKSDQGVTPLDLAIQANQIHIIEILKEAGAKDRNSDNCQSGSNESSTGDKGSIEHDWVVLSERLASVPALEAGPLETKLLLVFDKPLCRTLIRSTNFGQFIYPREQEGVRCPGGFIFQVSEVIETLSNKISVRRAPRRANMNEYPLKPEDFNYEDILYDIHQVRPDYQEFELSGRHQKTIAEKICMHKTWTGSWKVFHKGEDRNDFYFRTTPEWSKLREEECKWVSPDGKFFARTGWDDETPNLCLEVGLESQMVDLIVSCWLSKLWAEAAASNWQEKSGHSSSRRG